MCVIHRIFLSAVHDVVSVVETIVITQEAHAELRSDLDQRNADVSTLQDELLRLKVYHRLWHNTIVYTCTLWLLTAHGSYSNYVIIQDCPQAAANDKGSKLLLSDLPLNVSTVATLQITMCKIPHA